MHAGYVAAVDEGHRLGRGLLVELGDRLVGERAARHAGREQVAEDLWARFRVDRAQRDGEARRGRAGRAQDKLERFLPRQAVVLAVEAPDELAPLAVRRVGTGWGAR